MKPANAYLKIQLAHNLNLSCAESRKFLRSIGLDGEIIATPGHSPDCVSLITDEGLAFTGDALSPAATQDSQSQVEAVWAALAAHRVRLIYPGHGPLRPMPGAPWGQTG